MTNEELITEYQKGNKNAIEMLYFQNIGLIRKFARPFLTYAELDDLLQEAYFPLVRCAETYNAERGAFSSYFSTALRHHYSETILRQYRDVRIPLARMSRVVQLKNQPEDEPRKVMAALGWTEKEYNQTAADMQLIDAVRDQGEYSLLENVIAYESGFESAENEATKKDLWNEIDKLNPSEQKIIREYYQDEKPMWKIAEELKLDCKRTSLIHRKALKRLKRNRRIIALAQASDIYGKAIKGVGLRSFTRSWTSATERVALQNYDETNTTNL